MKATLVVLDRIRRLTADLHYEIGQAGGGLLERVH